MVGRDFVADDEFITRSNEFDMVVEKKKLLNRIFPVIPISMVKMQFSIFFFSATTQNVQFSDS